MRHILLAAAAAATFAVAAVPASAQIRFGAGPGGVEFGVRPRQGLAQRLARLRLCARLPRDPRADRHPEWSRDLSNELRLRLSQFGTITRRGTPTGVPFVWDEARPVRSWALAFTAFFDL